ncbi:NAD(P)-binding domain-containing protein [Streptomyces verrucosisporus]|uniref:NAD(P)-binding domain-containing protein n=1 Tax=Streptomyces verrucosisporus TaxID=1695161 RepID=UPI0019D220D4|nr:NAD(P)-binding domain-containing protein [Streptomyces verrucosisporus]MBN3930680.1 NAD(P)-binding domain-containing protein [Streptomyces verrucosisporus]
MRVGVIGAGAMGRALARRAALAGAVVLLSDRSIGKARRAAAEATTGAPGAVLASSLRNALSPSLVVLTPDREESLALVRDRSAALAEKFLVDATAPPPPGTADAAATSDLVAAAPAARWVKVLAAADADAVYSGRIDGLPIDMFVASDDEDAKVAVAEMMNMSGLRALDTGTLDKADALDAIACLARELSDRLLTTEGWGVKFLPDW